MRTGFLCVLLFCGALVLSVQSQEIISDGISIGNFVLNASADGSASYDSRVRYDEIDDEADSDYYADFSVGASIANRPAVYSVSAAAAYGRRYYVEYTSSDAEFYNVGASIGSSEGVLGLRWQLSADADKVLGYDVAYDPETGEGPDSILSDEPTKGWSARGSVNYDIPLSQKLFIIPGYAFMHYYRELDQDDSAEWQNHDVSLLLNYLLSENVTLLAGTYYTLQQSDDEDGYIITVGGGARGRLSEKTTWSVIGGVAHVDYDSSGTDEGGVVDITGNWQATDKLSLYIFYGNTYEPGYGGGKARLVYRGGYGLNWRITRRWSWNGQVLHDYTEEVGSGTSSGQYGDGVNHFLSTRLSYNPTARLSAYCGARHAKDQYETNQHVLSLGIEYRY